MDAVLSSVRAALARTTQPGDALCVGLSGGMDSVVLLHALMQLRDAGSIAHPLEALHVHHGLSPHADAWAAFCAGLCERWEIPLQVCKVSVVPDGRGLEAAARAARYAAHAQCGARWLLQAHHADDQVETLVLRLSRGTGLRGLAGMPAVRTAASGPSILRPLLELGRPQLLAHAKAHALTWIEDESNADQRLDRNYVRHQVLPPLAARFPAWRENWLRAARHAADALQLLDERAREDAGPAPLPTLERLRALSPARLQNLLRWLVTSRGEEPPDAARLADVERCLRTCEAGATLGIRFGASALFQYRGQLHWAPASRTGAPLPLSQELDLPSAWWAAAPPAPAVARQAVQAADAPHPGDLRIAVPALQGELVLRLELGSGLALQRVTDGALRLHGAEPGASLRLHPGRPRRTLKNLWQEAAVPPWERDWLPRLSLGRDLVWVAGVGLDCGFAAREGEPGLLPEWRPRS